MSDWREWPKPIYGPAYPEWAAQYETDETRRDLARALLLTEGKLRKALAVERERDALAVRLADCKEAFR